MMPEPSGGIDAMEGMTQGQLAELAGVTARRLAQIDKDADGEGEKLFVKADGGGYDPAIFVQRFVAYRVRQATKGAGFDAIRTEHEAIKAEKTRLQVLRMRGDMVDTIEVQRLWGDVINTFKQALLQIPAAVAQTIQGMTDAGQISRILEEELRAAMIELTRAESPQWTREEVDDAEEESEDAE